MLAIAIAGPAAGADETSITLMTYNIHVGVPMGQGIGPYKVQTSDLDNLAEVIKSADPDVVALQEVDGEYGLTLPEKRRSSLLNQARYLAGNCGGYNYVFGSAQDDTGYPTDNGKYVEWGSADRWTNNDESHGEVGNALLSRLNFAKDPENLPLPKDEGQERRACIKASLDVPVSSTSTKTVLVYATHLQHDNAGTRYKQLQSILDDVASLPKDQLVFIMGDLNHEHIPDEGQNPIQLALDAGFYDLGHGVPKEPGSGEPTYPADNPNVRIDFILCNKPLKVLQRKTICSQASDHCAVVVTATGEL